MNKKIKNMETQELKFEFKTRKGKAKVPFLYIFITINKKLRIIRKNYIYL